MKPRKSAPALIRGPYAAPACEIGASLKCEIRGRVNVRGLTDAPIPWPWTYDTLSGRGRTSVPTLVVCGDLATAIRTESIQALMHHFGISRKTAYRLRKALGVGRFTPGTTELWRELAPTRLKFKRKKVAK
jgi:hypothetical protein